MIPHFPAALKAFAAHVADPQRLGKQQKLEIDRARKNIVILDGDTVALTTPQKIYSSTRVCCCKKCS